MIYRSEHPVEREDRIIRNAQAAFQFEDHGSILLIFPQTDEAREWLKENTDGLWWAGGLVVEPRYFGNLVEGMLDYGWSLPR